MENEQPQEQLLKRSHKSINLHTVQTNSFTSQAEDARILLEELRETINYFKLKDLQEDSESSFKERPSITERDLFVIQQQHDEEDGWRNWHTHKVKNDSLGYEVNRRQVNSDKPNHPQTMDFSNIMISEWRQFQNNSNPSETPSQCRDAQGKRGSLKKDISSVNIEVKCQVNEAMMVKRWFDSSKPTTFDVSELKKNHTAILYNCSEYQLQVELRKLKSKGIYIETTTEQEDHTSQRKRGIALIKKKSQL